MGEFLNLSIKTRLPIQDSPRLSTFGMQANVPITKLEQTRESLISR